MWLCTNLHSDLKTNNNKLQKYQTNIRLYPYFRMASDGLAWIAVFFLYMSSVLPLEQVIQLSAIYYLSVFVLEVPSGYFSDRFGRRTTLMLSAFCMIIANSCFIVGGSFAWFAVAQFFLAAGIAMQSGTDTAFHYDSLTMLGQEHEYQQREAKAEQWGMIMLAIATLSGGTLGLIDLRLAYGFALLSAVIMASLVWCFSEPRHSHNAVDENLYKGFLSVLKACFARLRDPVLLWIFLVMIALYTLAHIVYEFYQPYISLLDISLFDAGEYAPLLSGIVISISMFGGALAARVSVGWHRNLGLVGLFLLAAMIQLSIVGSMALLLHSSILVLICARNFPMSLVHAPVNAAIAPRISNSQRATYLSVQGLAERVVFALFLVVLAGGLEKGQPVDEAALVDILMQTFLAGAVLIALLFLSGKRIARLLS
jgi:MFS family permease